MRDPLDRVLARELVVEPPPELRARLMELALGAPLPASPVVSEPARARWLDWDLAAALAAGLLLALAAGQLLGWVDGVDLVLGDVEAALALVASSPTAALLSWFDVDPIVMALWAGAGAIGLLLGATGALDRPAAA